MTRKIKLIWDFRGPTSSNTAIHYVKHLKEFIILEKIDVKLTGHEIFSDVHSIAFLVIDESLLNEYKEKLKPHRGQVYQD